jgi:hypothetical protein
MVTNPFTLYSNTLKILKKKTYLRGYVTIEFGPQTEHEDKWFPLQPRSPNDGNIFGEIRVLVTRKLLHKVFTTIIILPINRKSEYSRQQKAENG